MSPSSTQQILLVRLVQQGFQIKSSRQRRLGAHPVCILSKKINHTHCKFLQVFEFSLTGGQTVLVWLRPSSSDSDWSRQVFESEIGLLRWLSLRSSVPAPRLLHVLQSDTGNPWGAFVTEGMTGEPIKDVYSSLSSWAKEELVRSYADFTLKMFDLDVPQTIGSISPRSSLDELVVIPKIGNASHARASVVFSTLQKYLEYLAMLKRRRTFTLDTEEQDRFRAQASISQLIAHLRRHLLQLDERCLRRVVLAHDGLGDVNFMVDSTGKITGVLDWWMHSTLPAIIAADYPPWLRYGGINDPRFAAPSKSWLETPEESTRLRVIYQEAVKVNSLYYTALMQGTQLREAVGWVFDIEDDSCCARMKQWTLSAFGPPITSPSALDDSRCIIA
ncbi:hypothetical protein K503DRAFT_735537 [Rhizopogon vinicolor AM-OR11-026]|uniref:Aminoglycoside phosphotransferase domain-containing protein n=1 Tax=Rhizopogon vinicolor AM-OR11-026 TaxID=1314800 RepID=A0A1B7N9G1_9AGAM|nr:hypothetical protein K503DRAFT_735537 [Rhizopogon vinicolor AM-OR11-026]